MTAHTPGPWAVKEYNNGRTGEYGLNGIFQQTEKGKTQAAPIVEKVWGATIEESDANARLIAAAPDLFTELRETLRDLTEWDGTPDALEVIKANLAAALAKVSES